MMLFDASACVCCLSEHRLPICHSESRAESLHKVCVQLTTGYDEYLCYKVLPFILCDKLDKHDSLVLIVSPLVSPIKWENLHINVT